MRVFGQSNQPSSSILAQASTDAWQGLPSRINQVLAHSGLSQTDLAKQLGMSTGFISEVSRGVKRPGPDFFMGVRHLLGVSIDWLMLGEGSMTGGEGIRQELFLAIRLQIAVARSAINDGDPVAKALMILIREGQLGAASADEEFSTLLERIAPTDADLDLAVELYNGHLWAADPIAQRRNLLAAAVAHFEARKPIDKLAAVTGAPSTDVGTRVQANIGLGLRVAGRDYIENSRPHQAKK